MFEFLGVIWLDESNKWRASRYVDGKTCYGGLFENEEEAAKASDNLVRKKKFWSSELNFPTNVTTSQNMS